MGGIADNAGTERLTAEFESIGTGRGHQRVATKPSKEGAILTWGSMAVTGSPAALTITAGCRTIVLRNDDGTQAGNTNNKVVYIGNVVGVTAGAGGGFPLRVDESITLEIGEDAAVFLVATGAGSTVSFLQMT